MSVLRPKRARTRLALSGALVSAVFLIALALAARTLIRRLAFQEIDGELDTLAAAIGSDYELVGWGEGGRRPKGAGGECVRVPLGPTTRRSSSTARNVP
jgi:hypothetical protein